MRGASSEALASPVATVTVTTVELPSTAFAGFTVQMECAGAPAHVNAALPLTPATELSSSRYVADCPLATVKLVGPSGARAKSTPVPVSCTVCGELPALSENVTVPVRKPVPVGAKPICTVQAAPGATVVPHVLLPATIEKSPAAATLAIPNVTPAVVRQRNRLRTAAHPHPDTPERESGHRRQGHPGRRQPCPAQCNRLSSKLVRDGEHARLRPQALWRKTHRHRTACMRIQRVAATVHHQKVSARHLRRNQGQRDIADVDQRDLLRCACRAQLLRRKAQATGRKRVRSGGGRHPAQTGDLRARVVHDRHGSRARSRRCRRKRNRHGAARGGSKRGSTCVGCNPEVPSYYRHLHGG